jgi:hypothetical protein
MATRRGQVSPALNVADAAAQAPRGGAISGILGHNAAKKVSGDGLTADDADGHGYLGFLYPHNPCHPRLMSYSGGACRNSAAIAAGLAVGAAEFSDGVDAAGGKKIQ